VSASTTSTPRARAAAIASNITAAGSPPRCATTWTPLRLPQISSCSRAAARKVSPAASRTENPWDCSHFASLPIEVVLPAPLTPASMMTKGRCGPTTRGLSRERRRSVSDALSSDCGSASAPERFQRVRRSASRRSVAATPTSPVSRADSSSSSVASESALRPTPERVRETLFNWLGQDLTGKVTLDPFAGSGALSIEALSRGAALAVAVDKDPQLVRALATTAAKLGTQALETHCADARAFLAQDTRSYDVIFLDPPFSEDAWAQLLPAAVARLAERGMHYVNAPA